MSITGFENIQHLLKTHYGATKVCVDSDTFSVYGSDIDSVCVAVEVEFNDKYNIVCVDRNNELKHVVFRLTEKINKVVDRSEYV